LEKEGEKNKEKSIMTWHEIVWARTGQKSKANVPVYNFNKMRRSRRTCYFGPQPKVGSPGTAEDNPIDLSNEGDN